jgi:WD40 repeat protein
MRTLNTVGYHIAHDAQPGLVSAISGDGTRAAVPTRTGVDFIDLRTGHVVAGLAGDVGFIENVAFAPDGRTVVTVGDDRRVIVWRFDDVDPLDILPGHAGRITGLSFSADGRTFYTSSLDGAVFRWDLSGKQRFGRPFKIGRLDPNAAASSQTPPLAIAPSGKEIAVSPSSGRIDLFSLGALRPRTSFRVAKSGASIAALAWRGSGAKLLVAWSMPTIEPGVSGPAHVQLWSGPGTPRLVESFQGISGTILDADWSPDGRYVAAITDDRGPVATLAIWSTNGARRILFERRAEYDASWVAFSKNSRFLASVWSDGVRITDLRSGKTIRTLLPQGGPDVAAFDPDGTLLTGSNDGTVQHWNPLTGRELGAPTQVTAAPVAGIAFDPSGDTFVTSGGSDGIPKLWTTSTLQQLGSDLPGDPGLWLNAQYTPNGKNIVVLSRSNRAWLWPASPAAWSSHACVVAGRTLSRSEWSRFVGGRAYARIC